MRENSILKIYGSDYVEMTKQILREAGLYEDIIKKGCREGVIGLKPNLVSSSAPDYGATTHVELLRGIIEYLKGYGDFDIRIYESSWVGGNTREAMKLCGYDKLCREFDIPFIDTKELSSKGRDCHGMDLKLCSCVDEIDYMINVPVLKGHCQTRITCALKNMKGLIPDTEKRRYHRMNLHEPIAHVNTAIKQDFILVDHICGDLTYEDGGNPVVRNCIMAAKDPVLVDAYVCRLLGYELSQVPYVTIAEGLGVGSTDLTHAQVMVYSGAEGEAGGFVPLTYENMCDEEVPDLSGILELKDAVDEVDCCSACYGYLIPALDRIREEGRLSTLKTRLGGALCIGQGYRDKTGRVGIGNCTLGFEYCIKGCPPTPSEIYEGLMAYMEG